MKPRVVVRAVQDVRVLLQQLPRAFDIAPFTDVVEFLDFFETWVRLGRGNCHRGVRCDSLHHSQIVH